ncbi:MAG: hypothetical protein ACRD5M_10175 [Candidatus Acidiferrales bacterium]
MNIKDIYLDALKELGYAETEARFLYIVGTHSGYFTSQQYLDFAGVKRGYRSDALTRKLLRNKHASLEIHRKNARIYHLFSRNVYSAIGKENIRNRRDHEFQFIKTRLVALDFILANQRHDYFETEDDKVRYFCEALGVEKHALPTKLYLGTRNSSITPRYFVDKFPMFLPMITGSPIVTFTYIAPEAENLIAFVTHLQAYLPLFRSLKDFNFLFISPCEPLFPKARAIFLSLVKGPLETPPASEIARYFRVRKLWESRQFAALKNEDIEFLSEATRRFTSERVQQLYKTWAKGEPSDTRLPALFCGSNGQRQVSFDSCLMKRQRFLPGAVAA